MMKFRSMPASHLLGSLLATAMSASLAMAQTATPVPPPITTPDRVETPAGQFQFHKGILSQETADKAYEPLDIHRAGDTYLNALPAVSMFAIRKGFRAMPASRTTRSYPAGATAYVNSQPPAPSYCWFYTNPQRTQGFWDLCPR